MDFDQARFNMIEQQIRPWEVLDTHLLDSMFHVKRENFVADYQKQLAFSDKELPLPNGEWMLQPKVEARLLQALQLGTNDSVLEVGTGSGYVTALIALLAKSVISIDLDPKQQALAKTAIREAGFFNATFKVGNGIDGDASAAPFDAIFVGGATPIVPPTLKAQLAINGRMVVIVGSAPVMQARLIQRINETDFSDTILFDTLAPTLKACDAIRPASFVF